MFVNAKVNDQLFNAKFALSGTYALRRCVCKRGLDNCTRHFSSSHRFWGARYGWIGLGFIWLQALTGFLFRARVGLERNNT